MWLGNLSSASAGEVQRLTAGCVTSCGKSRLWAKAFLTNDKRLSRLQELIDILVLDDFVE